MSAPTRSRTQRSGAATARARTKTAEVAPEDVPEASPRPAAPSYAPRRGTRAGRSTAAERAYARRAQRVELMKREQDPEAAAKPAAKAKKSKWPSSRASFVLMMMGLLVAGVVATLWLSTQAIADSYRLEQLRGDNAKMAEQVDSLQRDVTKQDSASQLAQRAQALGMVPGGDPARLVVGKDGSITVVGDPQKAKGDPPSTQPVPQAPAAPGTQQGPVEGDQPAVPANGGN
jgi:hypothetical protein